MVTTGPLTGLRILSVEQYGAGPFATMLLGDMGAEVIKVEDPETGDVGRHVPPYLSELDSVYFQSLNRNKKSLALDIGTAPGREAFEKLVRASDAVFNNLRGDQPTKRGLDYASLQDVKPEIVCAHLTGFGREGPRVTEPGYDYLMQGYAGWMSITGEPDSPPQKSGLSLVDLSAGIAASLGTVSAIHAARETGLGRDIDVSLFDTAFSLLTYVGAWHLTKGYEPQRQPDSSHPSQVPSQVLPTADGWLVVMCAKEKFFQRLVAIMECPGLAEDPRFADFSGRLANRDALISILKDLSRQRTTEDWLALLRNRVPCAPVNSIEQALQDPQVVEGQMILDIPHETFGTVRQLASPIRYTQDGPPEHLRGPLLGEHTRSVLTQLAGMTADQAEDLINGTAATPDPPVDVPGE